DDAGRVTAHRPDLVLREPGELALGGGDDDIVLARGHIDPGQLVLVAQRDRADAGRPDLLELLERGLLDDAGASGEDQVGTGTVVRQDARRYRALARHALWRL